MIKFEYPEVFGWEAAIRGMRNPLESWKKSDSGYGCGDVLKCDFCGIIDCPSMRSHYVVGPNDLALMRKLVNAGSDHAKFMRFIIVTCDITAPLYWWKEYDTYKVGTVANSCSTMHTIHKRDLTPNDFSHDHLHPASMEPLNVTLSYINAVRSKYLASQERQWWHHIIQLLPSSYNQRRTVLLNYAVLRNIYYARKNHKLTEWHTFCDFVRTLPYSELITGEAADTPCTTSN